MIRIEEIKLSLSQNETELKDLCAAILHLPSPAIHSLRLVKKAIDSRKKTDVFFVYTVDVSIDHEEKVVSSLLHSKNPDIRKQIAQHRIRIVELYQYSIPAVSGFSEKNIFIAGAGPCGLFAALALAQAGLHPIVIERGKSVDERVKDVSAFFEKGILNPESNVQFGEGGAGTFSDGKLYTLVNDHRTHFIFKILIECGAPEEILYDAKPHIGTDILREIVKNVRQKIIDLGGSFRFKTKLTGIVVKNNVLQSIILNENEEHPATALVLAIGHSSRDTLGILHDNQLVLQQKAFSVGVRIEHPSEWINRSQYGVFARNEKLPPAKYKLAVHLPNGRSVYTFCMCPGGYVVAAASEPNSVVTNGMSEYRQNAANSNSAVLVNVHPADFGSPHPLAGINFQRSIEQKAFHLSGENYAAPAQTLEDFLKIVRQNIFPK